MKCPEDIRIEVLSSTGCSHVETLERLRCRVGLPTGRNREVAS
jgi:hypothetical protein